MAGAADCIPIDVAAEHIAAAKERYASMGTRAQAGEYGWAGFAAELALIAAGPRGEGGVWLRESGTLDYDLELRRPPDTIKIEVKTRVAVEGWAHPEKFDWIVVPTHDGREPVKRAADMVLFCWYPLQTDVIWALGFLRGVTEFQRRAVFYRENEPLPRGGWAGAGGAYALHLSSLRPLPAKLFDRRT